MGSRICGIFLDFYGTVVGGDREAVEAICADVIACHGLQATASGFATQWGANFFAQIEQANGSGFCTLFECERRSLRQTLQQHGVAADPTPYVRRLQQYWRRPMLWPEVADLLANLDLPVCLVSNADCEDLSAALEALDLRFDHVVTSEDARSYKPHPGIFLHALERTGWPAEHVLHVGDSLHSDIHGARRCGLWTAWLDRPGRISDVGTCESHYRIEVLDELIHVIDGRGKPPCGHDASRM